MASFSSLMLSHHSSVLCLFNLFSFADFVGYVLKDVSGTKQIAIDRRKSSDCTCIMYKCRSLYCIHNIDIILL